MKTCKAQESVKKPLTAQQIGEQRNMKSQCNTKNKDKTINSVPVEHFCKKPVTCTGYVISFRKA